MDQTGQQVFVFLQHYGYLIMLPLMIVEGPIVTIVAATLASLGAFNVFAVLAFSIIGDVVGDVLWYGVGYKFRLGFVRRIGKYIGITESLVARIEEYFTRHGGKTIFAVKSTTGLCWAAFTAAGIARMNFGKFLKYSIYGGVVWSGALVALGYFYGYLWREIKEYIDWIGWVIFGLTATTVLAMTIYKNLQAKKIFRKNNNRE